jgi:acyl carrier protein
MKKNQILEKITLIFRDVFDDQNIVLTPSTTANDINDWDSLSHIRLIITHEEEFGIRFKTTEISDLKNVGDFIDVLMSKLE